MTADATEPTIRFDVSPRSFEGSMSAKESLAYAEATLDPPLAGETDLLVSPMSSTRLIHEAANEVLNTMVENGAVTGPDGGQVPGVHAEHDLVVHHPIAPEQAVSWHASMRSAHQTPAGVLLSVLAELRDDRGTLLIEHLWSTMMVKGSTTCLQGPPVPDHRFPESARAHHVGEERVALSRDRGVLYGEASGDRAGHAVSDEIARQEGYPSMILQGMCSLAICSGAALRLAGGGDHRRIRRIAGRLAAPVVLGQDLLVRCYEIEASTTAERAVAFEAHQGDTLCVAHGRLELGAAP